MWFWCCVEFWQLLLMAKWVFFLEICALCGEQEGVMVCDDLVLLLALSVPRWTCMLDCTEQFSKSPKREQMRQNVEIQKLLKFIWF